MLNCSFNVRKVVIGIIGLNNDLPIDNANVYNHLVVLFFSFAVKDCKCLNKG